MLCVVRMSGYSPLLLGFSLQAEKMPGRGAAAGTNGNAIFLHHFTGHRGRQQCLSGSYYDPGPALSRLCILAVEFSQ